MSVFVYRVAKLPLLFRGSKHHAETFSFVAGLIFFLTNNNAGAHKAISTFYYQDFLIYIMCTDIFPGSKGNFLNIKETFNVTNVIKENEEYLYLHVKAFLSIIRKFRKNCG